MKFCIHNTVISSIHYNIYEPHIFIITAKIFFYTSNTCLVFLVYIIWTTIITTFYVQNLIKIDRIVFEIEGVKLWKKFLQYISAALAAARSMSAVVNHYGHCIIYSKSYWCLSISFWYRCFRFTDFFTDYNPLSQKQKIWLQ